MWRNGRFSYDAGWRAGICFGGGESSSSSDQTTNNYDQRSATGAPGSVAVSGSSVGNLALYNVTQSSDPAVIAAAIKSLEDQLGISSATLLAGTGAAFNTATSLGAAALGSAGNVAGAALDTAGNIASSAFNAITGAGNVAGSAISTAGNIAAGGLGLGSQAVSTTGNLAASAIGGAQDLANVAITENAGLSQDAIDQWAQVIHDALGGAQTSITEALNALAGQSASTSALASQSLTEISPLQSVLKVIVFAGAAVAIVYFLSRD